MLRKLVLPLALALLSSAGFAVAAETELPAAIRDELVQYHGATTKEFALVTTLPRERFAAVDASLREAGYRLTRLRPYQVKRELLISAVWIKGGPETKAVFDLTTAAAPQEVEDQRQAGFGPMDVSGYVVLVDGQPAVRHVVVFEKSARPSLARVYFEVPPRQHTKVFEELRNSGLSARIISLCQDDKKSLFVDGLWSPAEGRWRFHWDQGPAHRAVMAEVAADYEQVDIAVGGDEPMLGGAWQNQGEWQSLAVHGLTPKEHAAKIAELLAGSWLPVAVRSAALPGDEVTVSSLWKRKWPEGVLTARTLHSSASQLVSNSKDAEALELFRQAVELRKKHLDANHPHLRSALRDEALCLERLQRPFAAAQRNLEALRTIAATDSAGQKLIPRWRTEIDDLLVKAVSESIRRGEFETAIQRTAERVSLGNSHFGNDHWRTRSAADSLATLKTLRDGSETARLGVAKAESLLELGQSTRDIPALTQALDLFTAHLSAANRLTLVARQQLGLAHTLQKNHDQAVEVYTPLIEHYRNQPTGDDPLPGHGLHAVGIALYWKDDLPAAIDRFTAAAKVFAAAYGETDSRTRVVREHLVQAQTHQAQARAKAHDHRAALVAWEAVEREGQLLNGDQAPEVRFAAWHRQLQAQLAALTPPDAEQYRQATAEVSRVRELGRERKYEEALKLAADVQAELERLAGADSPPVLEVVTLRGHFQFQLGQIDAAIALYEAAFAALGNQIAHAHSETNEAADHLVFALKQRSADDRQELRLVEAEQSRRRILEVTQLLQPQVSWKLAEAQAELADARRAAQLAEADVQQLGKAQSLLREVADADAEGKFSAALEKAGEATAIYGRILGTDDGTYGVALRWMAKLFHSRSKPERATSLLDEEATRTARRYGNAHPTTAERQVELGYLLMSLRDYPRAIGPLNRAAVAYRNLPNHREEFHGALDALVQALEATREQALAASDCRAAASASNELALALAERHGADDWRAADARRMHKFYQELAADPQQIEWAREVGNLLSQIASKSAAGENEAALGLARQAETLARKVSAPGNHSVGVALSWQAGLLANLKQFAAAQSTYESTAVEYSRLYAAHHPNSLQLQQQWALADEAAGRFEAAADRLRRAFQSADQLPKTESARLETGEALLRMLSRNAARAVKGEEYARALAIQTDSARWAAELYGDSDERTSNLVLQRDYLALMEKSSTGVRQKLQEAERLRDDAWAKYTQGDLAAAIEGYRESRARFLAELGRDHHYTAAVTHTLGWMSQLYGDTQAAEPLLREALAARERSLPKDHVDRAHSIQQLGRLFYETSRLDEAEKHYNQALELFRKLKGPQHTATASCLNQLGLLVQNQGDLPRAEKLFQEAREIWVQNSGASHPEVAVLDNNLGLLAQARGQYGPALTQLSRALSVLKNSPAQWQGMYALTLCNLAELHLVRQAPEQAEPLLAESLAIRRRLLPAAHPDVVRTDLLLARTYAELKRPRLVAVEGTAQLAPAGANEAGLSTPVASGAAYAAAIDKYRSDYSARRQALGDNHPLATGTRNALVQLLDKAAQWYDSEDDFEQAAQAYRELEELLAAALGQNHFRTVSIRRWAESHERAAKLPADQQATLRTARAKVRQARQHKTAGQNEAALPLLLEAYEVVAAQLGPDTLETVLLLGHLSHVERNLGRYAAAIEHNALALRQQEKLAGRRDRVFATILRELGYCHFQLGHHAEAETYYREAVATLRDLNLTADELYPSVIRGLAGVFHHTWNNGQARELLVAEIGNVRLVFGDNSEEHAEFLDLLVSIDRDLGDYKTALEVCRQALAIRSQVHGPLHDETTNTLDTLGRTFFKSGDLGQAEAILREVLKRRTEKLGPEHALVHKTRTELNSLLSDIAIRLFDLENYALSAKYWSEVHSLRESLFGPKDWKTANARTGSSRAKACAALDEEGRRRYTRARTLAAECRRLDKLGRYKEAVALAHKVIAEYGELLGKDHPDVALEYDQLARVQRLSGDAQAAETACREALRIHEAASGKRHSSVAGFVGHLALIREVQGDFPQALALRQEALKIAQQIPDLEPAKVEQHRDRLSETSWNQVVALRSQEKWEAAIQGAQVWKELIAARRGPGDWRTVDAEYELQKLRKQAGLTVDQRRQVVQADEKLKRAVELNSQGKTDESLALAEEVAKTYGAFVGPETREHAHALLWHGVFALTLKKLEVAETSLRESERIWTKVAGRNHPQSAEAGSILGACFFTQGKIAPALEHYREAYERYQKCHGPAHASTKEALETLLSIHRAQAITAESKQDFKLALQHWNKQVELATEMVGPLHWRTADARAHAAGASRRAALTVEQLARAEQAYLTIAGNDEDVASIQKNPLAHLEKVAPETRLRSELLGADDLTMLEVYRALAMVADWGHDSVQKLHFLQQAETQAAQALTKAHPLYAEILAEYATGLLYAGSESRAIALLRSALEIRKAALGDSETGYAAILQQLAWARITVGQNAEARRDFYAAAKIYAETQGKADPNYVNCLKVLGGLHRLAGEHELAEQLFSEAQAIAEKTTVGGYAELLRFRAMNLFEAQRWKEAAGYYEQAYAQQRERHGPQAPDTMFALRELADAKLAQGDKLAATKMFSQVLSGYAEARTLSSEFSEARLSSLAEDAKVALDAWVGLSVAAELPADKIYSQVLDWKGAAFDTQRRVNRSRVKPELYPLLDELDALNSELSAALFAPPDPANKPKRDAELDELRARKRKLEQALTKDSAAFRRAQGPTNITAQQILEILEPGIAVVDFLVIDDPLAPGEQQLLGFVLRRGQDIVLLDFQQEAKVAGLVKRWRAGLGADADSVAAGAALKKLIWEPLSRHLGADKTVLFSPHGSLLRFPFAALPGTKANTYLIEEGYRFAVIPSTRALPELLTSPKLDFAGEAAESLLVLGGVDYGADPGQPVNPDALALFRSGVREGGESFQPLKGAKQEQEAIGRLFRAGTLNQGTVAELTEGLATEQALRQASSRYRYWHFATHGFESHPRSPSDQTQSLRFDSRSGTSAHEGQLSGIVLAGANQGGRSQPAGAIRDDGIMTALEVADLDFSQAQLVTLSACETGLGKTTTGEGVLGMQRAFHLAGAKTCVAALWRVNDQATAVLMEEYYRRLWIERERPLEALTNAQLTLLKDFHFDPVQQSLVRGAGGQRPLTKTPLPPIKSEPPKAEPAKPARLAPAYWASLVLSGDWR